MYSKKALNSDHSQLKQFTFLYFLLIIKLKKFFQIVSSLTQKRPHSVPLQGVPKTFAEAPEIFGYSDKAFRGRTRSLTEITFFLTGHVSTAPQKNITDLFGCFFKIFPAS